MARRPITYHWALVGREVAEALDTELRWDLVRELHSKGMTDRAIAEWTRMTLYTTARIRAGLGLAAVERTPAIRILKTERRHAAPVTRARGAA